MCAPEGFKRTEGAGEIKRDAISVPATLACLEFSLHFGILRFLYFIPVFRSRSSGTVLLLLGNSFGTIQIPRLMSLEHVDIVVQWELSTGRESSETFRSVKFLFPLSDR